MPTSSWEDAKPQRRFPALKEDITTDIAVIGGGLAGLLIAYRLAQAGRAVVLFEKDILGGSTTSLTTAFLTKDIDTDLSNLKSMFGARKARLVWESHQKAVDELEAIAQTEDIACDFKRVPLYIYASDEKEFEVLEKDFETAQALGMEALLQGGANALPFPNAGYLELPRQAKFHPLKFLTGVAKAAAAAGVNIYEKTEVRDIRYRANGATISTTRATVRAREVILATYQPFKNPWATFLKKGMYVSYVLEAAIPAGTFPEALYLDAQNPYHYFRIDAGKGEVSKGGSSSGKGNDADADRLILGGEDHRKEIPMQPAKNFAALKKHLDALMAGRPYTIVRKWTGPILEPSDGLALIGRTKEHELVATAFSGNGMTYAMIAAQLITDIILKKKNPWRELYDPKRIPTPKQLAKKALDYGEELFEGAVKNTIKGMIRRNKSS